MIEEQGMEPEPWMPGPEEEVPELEKLRAEVEEAYREGKEYLQLLQRVQADFVNYRRRIEQEREEQAKTVKAQVILRFLPILDDFERATQAIPEQERDLDWVQGVDLIRHKFWHNLESEGVRRIEAIGRPFDPWEEEAVLYEERTNEPEGTVLAILREGYKMDGRVIRPAQVIVAK